MSNGGASYRALSRSTRTGPARALPMRGATSLEYISGELEALENRLSSTMARSTPANGSLHRKSFTDSLEVFQLTNISTIEYATQQLIQGYKDGDNVTQSFLDNYDFYIFPFVNPDGFVYSQTNERLWRKNRQPPPKTAANQTCFGRDINRNWETNWDADPRGASPNECSQTYRGVVPRDTPENDGLDNLVRKIRDEQGIKLFIDWHSYSQLILSPFGHKETLYAPELGKWTKTAALMSEAIRAESSNATTFTFGPSGAVLYPTTGSSVDHIYTIGRAEFSYTIELPDYGDFGFILPPERIRPTVEEQWVGQQVLLSLLDEEFFDGDGPAILTL